MCTKGMLILSIITTGFLAFVNYPEKLFPQVPVSSPIPTPEQIPAFTSSPSFERMPAVELIPASEEVPPSTPVPAFELTPVLIPAPLFEPITVVEPPLASEEVPIEVLATSNETEPAPTWWGLLEEEQIFWWTFVPYIIFIFLILWLRLQCIRGEYEREQDLTQLPRNIQVGESIIRQLRGIMANIQEAQDEHSAQVENEMESMKEEMEMRERYFTEYQNEMDSIKTRIKAQDDHLTRLKTQMRLMESLIKEEGKRCAQIQEEVHSLKMVAERLVSMPMEQMVEDPVSMEHSCQDDNS